MRRPFIVNEETVFARNKAWAAIAAVRQEIVSGEDPVTVLDPDTDTVATFCMRLQSGYWRAQKIDDGVNHNTDGSEHEDDR